MTRSFFLIVIFLALSCQINEKSEIRYNYLALGDSYTIAESLNLIDSYPHQLKNQLKKIDSVNIIAKTGWTTGELIDSLKSLNINNKYDYVSLLIGVNNQYREYEISIFEKELNAEILSGNLVKGLKYCIKSCLKPIPFKVISIPCL